MTELTILQAAPAAETPRPAARGKLFARERVVFFFGSSAAGVSSSSAIRSKPAFVSTPFRSEPTSAGEGLCLMIMSISDGSCLAVLAAPDCDMGLVAYQMTLLVERAGQVLTPAVRAELQAARPR